MRAPSFTTSLTVRMSVIWLPTWKWKRRAAPSIPRALSIFTAWISSGVVSPNLAKSPDDDSHFPVLLVESLLRSPIRGWTFISSDKRSSSGSSESFSTTTMILRPSLRPRSASRRYSSSL